MDNQLYVFLLGVVVGFVVGIWLYRIFVRVKTKWDKKRKLNSKRKPGPKGMVFAKPTQTKTIGSLTLTISKDDSMFGYTRDAFGPHLSMRIAGDGRMTPRDTVLMRDGKNILVRGDKIISGNWRCPYTGAHMTHPAEIEIDHVVPLSEAWRSGAQDWPVNKCLNFGRDPSNLVAVSKAANREKSGHDISKWQPKYNTIEYVAQWLSIKAFYGLSLDAEEYRIVESMLQT